MADQEEKFEFTKEDIITCLSILPGYVNTLREEENEEDAEAIEKLCIYLTNLDSNRLRHYCCKCGAKRNESDMRPVRNWKPGRQQWECIACGDSRFAEVEQRLQSASGESVMKFKLRKSRRK